MRMAKYSIAKLARVEPLDLCQINASTLRLFEHIVDIAQSRWSSLAPFCTCRSKEPAVPLVNVLFLALVVFAFSVFALALAYGSVVASGIANRSQSGR